MSQPFYAERLARASQGSNPQLVTVHTFGRVTVHEVHMDDHRGEHSRSPYSSPDSRVEVLDSAVRYMLTSEIIHDHVAPHAGPPVL